MSADGPVPGASTAAQRAGFPPDLGPAPPLRGDLPAPAPLSGWGRFPVLRGHLRVPEGEAEAAAILRAQGAGLAPRGLGRAYGDAALPPAAGPALALSTLRLNRFVAVDEAAPRIVAEAGVTLADMETALLPRGLFPPVVPGTRFVTLGGMIAADVHGKNHHAPGGGSLSAHLDWVEVMGGDGAVRRLAPGDPGFAATCGGMGLTGLILRASLRLRRVETGWLRQEVIPAPGLAAAMAAIEDAAGWTHTSAWIDCLASGDALGRALVYRAEDAGLAELGPAEAVDRWALKPAAKRLGPPPDLIPGFALNALTVRAFNALYWRSGLRAAERGAALTPWSACFHPLDAVLGWNRIYGRRGFVQFQCVLPPETAAAGLREMLETVSAARQGSFLAVLKALGEGAADASSLSFPRRGWTLALDFPATPRALRLVARLRALTAAHGGRLYLAKDATLGRAEHDALDPRAAAFRAAPARDPAFLTELARRLGL
ncbi:MAG: FAD-binding oxidoreductase [Pseudomonadota bacterium]|nr:FAD-binding oxidoreductase [Pseudomonadota bacterium]